MKKSIKSLQLIIPKTPFTPTQWKQFQKMWIAKAPKKAIAAAMGCSVFKVSFWSSESFRRNAIAYRAAKAKEMREKAKAIIKKQKA